MNRRYKRALKLAIEFVAVVAAIFACGCSATQKILQTEDIDLIYNTAVKYYNEEDWKSASRLFEGVEAYFVGPSREDSLEFFRARCAYKLGDFEQSAQLCDEFRRTYGRSVFLEDAEGIYTMSYYYQSPSANRDIKMTQTAIMAIDEFTSRYPESAQRETFLEVRRELEGRLHEKSFDNAYTYFKIGRYKSSIIAFRSAMKEYPESEFREEISFYIVASAYELAHNSVEEKKEDRYLSVIDTYYTFISEFPDSQRREQADKMLKEAEEYIAKLRENEGKDLTDDRVIFWKRIFAGGQKEEKIEKVEVE